jgi:hypothetical protein
MFKYHPLRTDPQFAVGDRQSSLLLFYKLNARKQIFQTVKSANPIFI